MSSLFGVDGLLNPIPPVKHKVFVSYHHAGDQAYYEAFSKAFHNTYDVIYDNSIERAFDSDNIDYVMQRIREKHITGSSCTIVLVGAATYKRKYVDWEIKSTLEREHALIGVQLPTATTNSEGKILVPDRLYDNIVSGYASWLTWAAITASATELQRLIGEAKARKTSLIVNSRERMLRNAP